MPSPPPQCASKAGCTLAVTPRATSRAMPSASIISRCSSRWRARRTASAPTSLCGGLEAGDDRVDPGVADDVEAALEARQGAGGDVVAHLLDAQVAVAAVARGVGVGLAQAGGPRADGPVDVEVAGQAVGADQPGGLAGLLLVGDQLGPVAEGLGAVAALPRCQHVGEVVGRRQDAPAVLVDEPDAGGRGGPQGQVDVRAALGRGDGGVERLARDVVGVPGDEPVAPPARLLPARRWRRRAPRR